MLVSSFTFSMHSQSRQERNAEKKAKLEAEYNQLKDLVASQNFMFEANWAIPLGNDVSNIGLNIPGGGAIFQGGRVDISNNSNFLKLESDNADLFLPYFGRVFFPKRTSTSRGIQYKGEINDYKVDINEKKKRITIKFNAKSEGDFLKFIITVYAGGKTSVAVNSTNRQTITYDGQLKPIESDK